MLLFSSSQETRRKPDDSLSNVSHPTRLYDSLFWGRHAHAFESDERFIMKVSSPPYAFDWLGVTLPRFFSF